MVEPTAAWAFLQKKEEERGIMHKKVFIDGSSGTTGLRLRERLQGRDDLNPVILPEERRHNPDSIRQAMGDSDITFLCLPDAAAREAAAMADELNRPDLVLIDTSTAHRTDPAWTYGFPELSETAADEIRAAKRISVPGCHASGFIALIRPLAAEGLLSPDALLSCFSLTGYSGGGKAMIADYESETRSPLLDAPRQYGLSQKHKHLPEMRKYALLKNAPVFCPVVADFYSGMEVTVPVFAAQLRGSIDEVKSVYRRYYSGPVVRYEDASDEKGFLSAGKLSGTDCMLISVFGEGERYLLTARFDNLGKGASGAAVECMNLVMGAEMTKGLVLEL